MPIGSRLFRKVTIIGVGLMGGSLGKVIKKQGLAKEVVGLSQKQTTLSAAVKMQAIDHGYHDIRKAVHNADLVVLATPVSIITGTLSMIGPYLKRGCIVTDVGSSKVSIVRAAQKFLPNHVSFVGSHPLTGSEKKGVQFADEKLFAGALCIMTPTDQVNRSVTHRIKTLWTRVGCRVKFLSPEEHDRIMAYISHLPHVMAFALMNIIPGELLEYSAQGLKDATRIASSSPQMWSDICQGNADNIIHVLDALVKDLAGIRRAIVTNESKLLLDEFQKAKEKRDRIG